jgi:hypothetical protein
MDNEQFESLRHQLEIAISSGNKTEAAEILAKLSSSISENKQRITALTVEGRRGRRREWELERTFETIESVIDALLLAQSRCAVLERQLDHAEHRADAAKIAELAPQINAACAERNKLQFEYMKLFSRLKYRFGTDVHQKSPERLNTA